MVNKDFFLKDLHIFKNCYQPKAEAGNGLATPWLFLISRETELKKKDTLLQRTHKHALHSIVSETNYIHL